MCILGIADRLLHMLTEERDEKVLKSVTVALETLSKTHSKQIVQNMIHYKLHNAVIILFIYLFLLLIHIIALKSSLSKLN